MTHFWSKKESLLYFIKKLKNKTEQQLKQAFQAASIFYEINNTDQDKIQILKNKKASISTKKIKWRRLETCLQKFRFGN
jgi:predicted type IV restriction endonuclease